MKDFVMTIGNIGSGKTTYLERNYDFPPYRYVSKDSLRYMFGNGNYFYDNNFEKIVKSVNWHMIDILCTNESKIVCDDTYINSRVRCPVIDLASCHGYKNIVALVFPRIDKDFALDRRMENPHDIPDRKKWGYVWDKFDNIYEEPKEYEGFSDIIYINKEEVGI